MNAAAVWDLIVAIIEQVSLIRSWFCVPHLVTSYDDLYCGEYWSYNYGAYTAPVYNTLFSLCHLVWIYL